MFVHHGVWVLRPDVNRQANLYLENCLIMNRNDTGTYNPLWINGGKSSPHSLLNAGSLNVLGLHTEGQSLRERQDFCDQPVTKFSVSPDMILYAVESLKLIVVYFDMRCSGKTTSFWWFLGDNAEMFTRTRMFMNQFRSNSVMVTVAIRINTSSKVTKAWSSQNCRDGWLCVGNDC